MCLTLAFPFCSNTLEKTPQEFVAGGREYKLAINWPDYLLEADGTPVKELPDAPDVEREGIPDVCQSQTLVVDNDALTHVAFNVVVKCEHSAIVVDHNKESLTTSLVVDGKAEK